MDITSEIKIIDGNEYIYVHVGGIHPALLNIDYGDIGNVMLREINKYENNYLIYTKKTFAREDMTSCGWYSYTPCVKKDENYIYRECVEHFLQIPLL